MQNKRIVGRVLFILTSFTMSSPVSPRMLLSTATSVTSVRMPCELHQGLTYTADQPKPKPGQSTKCSSANECLALGKQYLAEPFGASRARGPLEKAVALDPTNAEAYKHLSLAHLSKYEGSMGHMSEDEYCLTERLCRTAISLRPEDAEPYLLLGQILNEETFYGFRSDDAAVEALKRALELKPAWPDAYCELAHAHYLRKQYEEATSAYIIEFTLRREDETHQGQINALKLEYQKQHEKRDSFVVAEIYTKLSKYDKALISLQQAERIDPSDETIRFWMGKIFLSLGDVPSAKHSQEMLVELCKSKDKFFRTQCEVSAQQLFDAIEGARKELDRNQR